MTLASRQLQQNQMVGEAERARKQASAHLRRSQWDAGVHGILRHDGLSSPSLSFPRRSGPIDGMMKAPPAHPGGGKRRL
jgi:hypothetical protein